MGLDKSLKDVDKVMLDLEENHSDVSSLQLTLGMSFSDDENVDWGLELSMLLDDDCVAPPLLANAMQPAVPAVPAAVPYEAAQDEKDDDDGPDAEAPQQAELKKTEVAVAEV